VLEMIAFSARLTITHQTTTASAFLALKIRTHTTRLGSRTARASRVSTIMTLAHVWILTNALTGGSLAAMGGRATTRLGPMSAFALQAGPGIFVRGTSTSAFSFPAGTMAFATTLLVLSRAPVLLVTLAEIVNMVCFYYDSLFSSFNGWLQRFP
jgi:hypothetical protein